MQLKLIRFNYIHAQLSLSWFLLSTDNKLLLLMGHGVSSFALGFVAINIMDGCQQCLCLLQCSILFLKAFALCQHQRFRCQHDASIVLLVLTNDAVFSILCQLCANDTGNLNGVHLSCYIFFCSYRIDN